MNISVPVEDKFVFTFLREVLRTVVQFPTERTKIKTRQHVSGSDTCPFGQSVSVGYISWQSTIILWREKYYFLCNPLFDTPNYRWGDIKMNAEI